MNAKSPYSITLVVCQLALIALIFSPVSSLWPPEGALWLFGAILVALAIVIALMALRALGFRSFSVMPEPAERASLTKNGPYRYVRHPMYLSVLLACSGVCVHNSSAFNWMCLACLFFVLILKIRREESLLLEQYDEYKNYRHTSYALLPFVI